MNFSSSLGSPFGSPSQLISTANESVKSSSSGSDRSSPIPQPFSSSGKILDRTVAWLTSTKSDASATASPQKVTADTLLTSIRETYGPDIAGKVESFHRDQLTQRGNSNKSLSKETIKSVTALADFLERSNLDASDLATSKQNVSHAETLCHRASLDVLQSLGLEAHGADLEQKLAASIAEATDPNNQNILLDPKTAENHVLNSRREAQSLLREAIKASPLDATQKKIALAKVDSDFKKSLVNVLNQQEWPVIETELEYSIDGKNIATKSVMTPASQMACLRKTYAAEGIGGVCSGDKKNQTHAINLFIDQLEPSASLKTAPSIDTASVTTDEDSDTTSEISSLSSQGETGSAPNKPIITLIRSGVHFPDSIEPSEQKAAFTNRFNEALLASVESKGLLPTTSSTDPIKITITDIGLLSGSIEYAMQQGQFTNLAKVNDETAQGVARELRYTPPNSDQEVTFFVQPTVLPFNFGARKVDKGMLALATEPSSWKQTNNESFDQLLGNTTSTEIGGLVAEALDDPNRIPPFTEKEKKNIKDLAQQCRDIRKEGTINTNDDDYYAVAARIIVLCDKLGIVPNIHCKSGKDRTSRAVEEAKMLAAEIDATGEVPTRGKLSAERQKIAEVFAQSGNAKLQQLNTGLIGNKQGKSFNLRVDDPMAQTFYAGLSAHTAT